jgi:tetratricopeptide (TPR) repeat protein
MLIVGGHGKLMSWENDLSNYEQKSVAVAFTILFEELERQYPDSSNLLKVLSFLDPEHIPLKMINDGADKLQLQSPSEPSHLDVTSHEPKFRQSLLHKFKTRWHRRKGQPMGLSIMTPKLESLIALIGAPVQLQSAIQQLLHSSLVTSTDTSEPNTDTSALRIHDLIKLMIQESVRRDNTHYLWFHVAAALVCGAFQCIEDPTSYRCWAQCETLNPHIHSLTMWDDANEFGNSELHQANIGIAEYFSSRGRYGEAEVLFRRALTRNEKLYGPKHPDTLCTIESLATTCYLQGQHHEAELLQSRVLASRERALGPEHADTLVALDNLAITYYLQGRYKEAETLQRRVLASREKNLGPEHPDTLGTMNNLALTYQSHSRYGEAEKLYKKALEGNERLLGPENLDVLDTIDNLAIIYRLQKRYREAEGLFRRVMESREMLLGRDHPDTLGTVNNLGIVYLRQERYKEAEEFHKRALAGNEKLLGANNPDTLGTVHNLALTYDSQGRHSEAEKLYKRALKGREEVLGPQHPDTVHTVRAFADFLWKHNRYRDRAHLKFDFPLAFTSR